eukprot:4204388-Amphidinium_carterae.1
MPRTVRTTAVEQHSPPFYRCPELCAAVLIALNAWNLLRSLSKHDANARQMISEQPEQEQLGWFKDIPASCQIVPERYTHTHIGGTLHKAASLPARGIN